MSGPIPENDLEFREQTIVSCSGRSFECADGWSFMVPEDSPVLPRAGAVARFYGEGIGRPVRGLTIDGAVAYYRTTAEQEEIHRKESAAFEAKCAEQTAATKTAPHGDERTMRESTAPTHDSADELAAYIKSLVDRPHDYGTCVYAMSLAATAALNHVARKLGVTGFQASCADIDIIRRTRHIDGPFGILKAEDACYPQYDLEAKLREWLAEWRPWIAEECRKKLAADGGSAHPEVRSHWERLAGTPS